MISAGAVRTIALIVCVAGIAGMIVTSILNHNGAAVTFGLITAVAILCSMVAKAVAANTERTLLGVSAGAAGVPATVGAGAVGPAPRRVVPSPLPAPAEIDPPGAPQGAAGAVEVPGAAGAGETAPGPVAEPVGAAGRASGPTPARAGSAPRRAQSATAEALAERVEGQVQAMVAAGGNEDTVRQLVGEAVRLGRALGAID